MVCDGKPDCQDEEDEAECGGKFRNYRNKLIKVFFLFKYLPNQPIFQKHELSDL